MLFRIRDVKGDGNCLFRAIADQYYGTEEKHDELRTLATNYIRCYRNKFQFLKDFNDSDCEENDLDCFSKFFHAILSLYARFFLNCIICHVNYS